MEEIVIPISFFAMVFGIVTVSVWASTQSKRELNETIRRAIDSGQKLDSEVISALHKPVRSPAQDFRGGIVLLCLAIGFVVAGLMANGAIAGMGGGWDDDAGIGFFVAAAIVGAIGLGQFVAAVLRRDPKKET